MPSINFLKIPRLPPAAFTMVMGTGAYAIACLDLSSIFPVVKNYAYIINIINFIIFSLLIILACLTWPRHISDFRDDLGYPQNTAFYSALAISLLVLGTQCLEFKLSLIGGCLLWGLGVILTFIINFGIFYHFFLSGGIELEHFTPVFFIPVGGLAVIPAGGCSVLALVQNGPFANLHDLLLMINTLALGSGLLLYFGIFSLLLQRHFLANPLQDDLIPTVWIHMAPIGWSGVGLLSIGTLVYDNQPLFRFLASIFWGGCFWWLIMASLLTLKGFLSKKIHFTLAFWAFIFPLGALTVLSFKLDSQFRYAFYLCWGIISVLWILCLCKTIFYVCIFIKNFVKG